MKQLNRAKHGIELFLLIKMALTENWATLMVSQYL